MPDVNEYPDDEVPLIPCPFCGSVPVVLVCGHDAMDVAVCCEQCQCRGPLSETTEEAIVKWNRCKPTEEP